MPALQGNEDIGPAHAGGLSGGRQARGLVGFLTRRWHGEVPLGTLFWRDMVGYGTAINIATMLFALLLLGMRAEKPLVLAVYFAAVPYNIFLFACLCRRPPGEPNRLLTLLGGIMWVLMMVVI